MAQNRFSRSEIVLLLRKNTTRVWEVQITLGLNFPFEKRPRKLCSWLSASSCKDDKSANLY